MSDPIILTADAALAGAIGAAALGEGVSIEAIAAGGQTARLQYTAVGALGVNTLNGVGDHGAYLDRADGADEALALTWDAPVDDVRFTLVKFAAFERGEARAYDAAGALIETLALSAATGQAAPGTGFDGARRFAFTAEDVARIEIAATGSLDARPVAFGFHEVRFTPDLGETPPSPGAPVVLGGYPALDRARGPVAWDALTTIEAESLTGALSELRYEPTRGFGVNTLGGVGDNAFLIDAIGGPERLSLTFAEAVDDLSLTLFRMGADERATLRIEQADGTVTTRTLAPQTAEKLTTAPGAKRFTLDEDGIVALSITGAAGPQGPSFGLGEIAYTPAGAPPPPPPVEVGDGAAQIEVSKNQGVQNSSFGPNAFQIRNTGEVDIASITLDIRDALIPDAVFDPFGQAGDRAFRSVFFGFDDEGLGGTGVRVPGPTDATPFDGPGGPGGYDRLTLAFDASVDGGFEPGELLKFGIDIDPNSILGFRPANPTPGDVLPGFDPGGISGLELSNAVVTIRFVDGTSAVGELLGDGSDGGSNARIDQRGDDPSLNLTVDGVAPGQRGGYDANPTVIVEGEAGDVARIVMIEGITQPFSFADAFGPGDWPANNAAAVQTVEVTLAGGPRNISNQFDFSGLDGAPIAFVGGVIEQGFAVGPVTDPIHLVPQGDAALFDFV